MNQLVEKEGFHQERGLVLCMNVWKKSRSRDKFERTLRNNEAFICLTPYKDRVTVRYLCTLFHSLVYYILLSRDLEAQYRLNKSHYLNFSDTN